MITVLGVWYCASKIRIDFIQFYPCHPDVKLLCSVSRRNKNFFSAPHCHFNQRAKFIVDVQQYICKTTSFRFGIEKMTSAGLEICNLLTKGTEMVGEYSRFRVRDLTCTVKKYLMVEPFTVSFCILPLGFFVQRGGS